MGMSRRAVRIKCGDRVQELCRAQPGLRMAEVADIDTSGWAYLKLPRTSPIPAIEESLLEIAATERVPALFGFVLYSEFSYVAAAAPDMSACRAILNPGSALEDKDGHWAWHQVERSYGQVDGYESNAAACLTQWAEHAPRAADMAEILQLLIPESHDPYAGLADFLRMFGLDAHL